MRPKVVLVARVRRDEKHYDFHPVEIRKGRPVAPDKVTTYYLRYSENGKRVVEPVGPNLDQAFVRFQNKELNRVRTQMGLSTTRDTSNTPQGRTLITDAVAKFIADLEGSVMTGDKSKETLKAYKNAAEIFRERCGVQYMNEITGDILRAHKVWLFANLKKNTHGKKINTVANRFRYLSVFLAKNGIQMTKGRVLNPDDKGLLDRSDVPRELKGEPVFKYSEVEINAMLNAADIDEADLIQTLLRTGFRDEEAAYLHWTDIDFNRDQITVSEKPKYEWRPKGRQARTLELEDGVLLKRLQARKERQTQTSRLVFPNTLNEPDVHLIRRLYKVVAKAEANGFKFEGRITQHRFRKTFASMMMATCDLQTVSELLGHKDIKTTIRYLAPDRSKARIGSRTAFKGIGV